MDTRTLANMVRTAVPGLNRAAVNRFAHSFGMRSVFGRGKAPTTFEEVASEVRNELVDAAVDNLKFMIRAKGPLRLVAIGRVKRVKDEDAFSFSGYSGDALKVGINIVNESAAEAAAEAAAS
jgi:hypothetical protein